MADEELLALLARGVEVWNKWREHNQEEVIDFSGSDLRKRNLSGAHLGGIDFRGSYFRDADLRGTNLSEARLDLSDLSETNLEGANLSRASLYDVNLGGATLRGANLNGADLSFTNFIAVDLDNTDLTDALCSGTVFSYTDLSSAIGLDTVNHYGSSSIDFHTLFRVGNRLPDVFLRGCGVSEPLLEYLPYMLNTAIDFYSCFISYSSSDKAFACRLHDTLQGRGIRCWLDEKQMNPGDDIYEEIHRGIRYWDKFLLCCSESSLTESGWVDFEVNKALQKERALMKERGEKVRTLIPLNLDGFLFSKDYKGAKGDEIRSRIAADFTGWETNNAIFEEQIERVIKALRTDGGKEPPPKSKL